MINISGWNWIIDTNDKTCTNAENNVIVRMEKDGDFLWGALHNMSMNLLAEISRYEDGEEIIKTIVKMAEEKYLENRAEHLLV